jgi:HAD superfamily hydrolase (TIGR01662 family)
MEKDERGAETLLPLPDNGASFSLLPRLHPLIKDARAVLFDAGGTLTHPDWERIALLAKLETGRAFETLELRRTLYEALRELDARLFEERVSAVHTRREGWVFHDLFAALGLDEETCKRLRLRIVAAHNEKHIWCGLDPEAPVVVNELKRAGLLVGVISNTEDGRLKELLELVEIAAHFDLLVDSYVVALRKPDAEIFRQALDQLALKPQEAVYVGDSYGHDIQGARSAGLLCAILLDPFDLYADTDCPRIHALSELTGEVGC